MNLVYHMNMFVTALFCRVRCVKWLMPECTNNTIQNTENSFVVCTALSSFLLALCI